MQINDKITLVLHQISIDLVGFGIHIPDHIDKVAINDWLNRHSDTIFGFISSFGESIEHLVLGAFYLFFILYYGDLVPQFFESKVKSISLEVRTVE